MMLNLVFNLKFYLVIWQVIFNYYDFVLFDIVKYLWTGNSVDRKFTIYGIATGHSSRIKKL